MPNNLARPRPDEWQRGDLFPFIEDAWSNSVGIVGNNNVVAARLTAIDEIFFAVHNGLKPANEAQLVPTLLFLRSFSAFRAAVMVGLSMPTDSFPVQRSCLEYAGYAKLVMVEPELAKLWLQHDQNLAEVRKKFSNRTVRESIEKDDADLAKIYQELSLALKNANDGTGRVFSSRITVRVIGGSARRCPSYDYHNDFGSVRVSIEGRGSPPILASKPRNR
jgi:hypothetical protein